MLFPMKLFAIFLVLLSATAFAQEAWRWVDENGVVHFSDTPRPGAERVELHSAQGFQAPRAADTTASSPGSVAAPDGGAEAPFQYDRLEVTSPAQDETLWNIGTELSVNVAIAPSLRPGHGLRLLVDGQSVTEDPVRATQFTVGGVYRGTHTAVVTVVAEDGSTVQQSDPRTFYVKQSVQQPRPTTRPRPRPGGG
jgi:hypothetical protein